MMKSRFHCLSLFCALVVSINLNAQVEVPVIRSQIELWLTNAQLNSDLTVAKLRFKNRDNVPPVLQLELRFINNSLDRFLANYEKTNGISFYEKAFFKLIHHSGKRREEISVHIHFSEEEYVTSWDRTNRTLLIRRGDNRMIRRTLSLGVSVSNTSLTLPHSVRLTSELAAPARIEKVVGDYFRNLRTDPPLHIQTDALEPDYLHLEVGSLKNTVLPQRKLWESLTLSFDTKRHNDQTFIICHADGSFATGVGRQVPPRAAFKDMEPEFRSDLDSFVSALLSHINKTIENP